MIRHFILTEGKYGVYVFWNGGLLRGVEWPRRMSKEQDPQKGQENLEGPLGENVERAAHSLLHSFS